MVSQYQGTFPVLVGHGRTRVPGQAVGPLLLVHDSNQWH